MQLQLKIPISGTDFFHFPVGKKDDGMAIYGNRYLPTDASVVIFAPFAFNYAVWRTMGSFHSIEACNIKVRLHNDSLKTGFSKIAQKHHMIRAVHVGIGGVSVP